MRNRKDLSMLINLSRRIRENPKEDLDDELFFTLIRSVWLDKSVRVRDSIVENYGKKYLRAYLEEGEGEWMPLRKLLLDFTDSYVFLDGFLLDDIIIEKGFIEELISAIDDSTMTAVADDISSYETDAAVVTDEALAQFQDIRKWNTDAVMTVPRINFGSGDNAKERLAMAYKNVLEKAADSGYKTLSIAPLSDYPLSLEGSIAASSVNIFLSLRRCPMMVTFILPDNGRLSSFLASDHQ